MTDRRQPATRFRNEIGIVPDSVQFLAFAAFLALFVCLTILLLRDHNGPPPRQLAPLLGLMAGTVVACYILLIGYVNKDAERRGMSRILWTLVAIFVPNALGIVLYFILRKPLIAHCPQCNAEVGPGFSFCPCCRTRLQPICPHCQRSVELGDKFCPYCGGALEAPPVAPPAPAPSQS